MLLMLPGSREDAGRRMGSAAGDGRSVATGVQEQRSGQGLAKAHKRHNKHQAKLPPSVFIIFGLGCKNRLYVTILGLVSGSGILPIRSTAYVLFVCITVYIIIGNIAFRLYG